MSDKTKFWKKSRFWVTQNLTYDTDIPTKIIKENSNINVKTINAWINKCILNSTSPAMLKLANIKHVYKKDQKSAKAAMNLWVSCQTYLKYMKDYYLNKWLSIFIYLKIPV